MNKNLAIIDIETTGGSAKRERIIEIAIVIFDGDKIINQFESLVNPERSIPPFISQMTGITNEMVSSAPKFFEIAKKIVELTEDCIFVAHNVRFDYGFVTEEFYNLGYTYSRKQLDTLKLFKNFFPGLKSYSLGKLIDHFNIKVDSRHRAMADVNATLEILKIGLQNQSSANYLYKNLKTTLKQTKFPTAISGDKYENLPEKTGVYYFYDEYGKILYIGKSINIKKRINQHFQKISTKSNLLFNLTYDVDYTLTGSELIAFLLEATEIKKHKPELNKALRTNYFPYLVITKKNKNGFLGLKIVKNSEIQENEEKLGSFSNKLSAKHFIDAIINQLSLCHNINNDSGELHQCTDYELGNCNGACIGLENNESYNSRILSFIEADKLYDHETFALIDIGRNYDESTVVLVENNSYSGYGYFNKKEESIESIEDARNLITFSKPNKDFDSIIRRFINENQKSIKILTW